MKNFIHIHTLRALPYSNLNRDDTGAPKQTEFGGHLRARLSSQAQKRAMRIGVETTTDRTFRSKYAPADVIRRVEEKASEAGVVLDEKQKAKLETAAKNAINALPGGEDKKAKAPASATLVWLVEEELASAASKIWNKIVSQEEDTNIKPEEFVAPRTNSLTVSAFGRMFASAPRLQTPAAIQVSHAITTHAISTEVDYFTAVDDLGEVYREDVGAGHLDISEHTSGVFYTHVCIDVRTLKGNWNAGPDGTERFAELVKQVLLALPTGKANATAPYTFPALSIAHAGSTAVGSLADAFESPIESGKSNRTEGYLTGSVDALLTHFDRAAAFMPEGFEVATFTGVADLAKTQYGEIELSDLNTFTSEVTSWVEL